ncbi:helix-turn-helix transcriptional regulator [Armatimonas rosea]|uniref:AraC-like DNA-binding protein n=1 Tax=Armatimonas rosea TaxID=685828 RepID=A0A7W9ST92_ARMRO|nr:AraC family transcriptional regulator [Armatimonas rosea]MBB6052266.1 AraC-like DNA-binding protein [Armatimonas rosea]
MSNLTFLASSSHPLYTLNLDKHLLGYYTIQYVCQGELEVAYDDQFYSLTDQPSGWFFPAYPGPRLRFHPRTLGGTWWHRHLAFQGDRVEQWRAQGLWLTEPQLCPESIDGGARLDTIIALSRATSRWSHERAINQLEALLLDLAEARTTPATESPWLARVLALLGEDFTPDYEQLARTLECSLATLRRRFKRETGQALHEYVIVQRVARARTLLLETDYPLREIAARLGYDSEFFFARQFKQVALVTPGEYRRSGLFIPPPG